MVDQINGIASGLVATRWFDAGVNPALATDPQTITPGQEARNRFSLNDASTVVKHTLQIVVSAAAIVNIKMRFTSQDVTPIVNAEKTLILNGGTALTADVGFQFDIILVKGASYDIQHTSGGAIVASVFISESFNVDI